MNLSNPILNNEDAEKSVLAALFYDNDNIGLLSELSMSDFCNPVLGKMFESASRIIARGEKADDASVYYDLKSSKDVMDAIASIAGGYQIAKHSVEVAAREVKSCFVRRRIIRNMTAVVEACSSVVEIDDLLAFVADASSITGEMVISRAPKTMQELMAEAWAGMVSGKAVIPHLKVGIDAVDNVASGVPVGAMTVIAARPSVGKTMYAGNVLANASLGGKSGIYFSLEDKDRVIISRILAREARLNIGLITHGYVKKEQHGAVLDAINAHQKSKMYIEDMSGLTVKKMRSIATVLKSKLGSLDFMIVDHLAHIPFIGSKYEGTSRNSYELANTIKELDCAGIVLHQLNRGTEKRDDPRPVLSDLKDSGDIEQHARAVHMLHAPCDYDQDADKTDFELIVRKASYGPKGVVKLYRDVNTMTIDGGNSNVCY